MSRVFLASIMCFAGCLFTTPGCSIELTRLPAGFVRLRDIDETIVQDIRYATATNFTGAVVPGYQAGECILLREVAEALKLVQSDLRPRDLSLKVYDCYRPVRAVKAFMQWVRTPATPGKGVIGRGPNGEISSSWGTSRRIRFTRRERRSI